MFNTTCPLTSTSATNIALLTYIFVQLINSLIQLCAIFANIFFIVVCRSASAMHGNMRLMLCQISMCFCLHCFAGLLYSCYFLLLGVGGFARVPGGGWWCSLINVAMVPWDAAAVLLVVGLGVERAIATQRLVPSGAISHYVKGIFAIAWTAALIVTIQYAVHLTNKPMCICDGASLSDRTAMMSRIGICACLESLTIFLFGCVLMRSRNRLENFGINTARYSLAKRFQIYETFRATQMLLPSLIVHAIVYIVYLILLIPVRDYRLSDRLTLNGFTLTTFVFVLPAVHALAHPCICISRHYYLRQKANERLSICCSIQRLPTQQSIHDDSEQEVNKPFTSTNIETQRSSFADHISRVEYRMAPEQHSQMLTSFWERTQ